MRSAKLLPGSTTLFCIQESNNFVNPKGNLAKFNNIIKNWGLRTGRWPDGMWSMEKDSNCESK